MWVLVTPVVGLGILVGYGVVTDIATWRRRRRAPALTRPEQRRTETLAMLEPDAGRPQARVVSRALTRGGLVLHVVDSR